MLTDEQQAYIRFLKERPAELARAIGFTKLGRLQNDWIRSMIFGTQDETLLAHRESYKTTCVSVALACICVLLPNLRTLFMRKTDTDVKEIVLQTQKILESQQMRATARGIYGIDLALVTASAWEVSTNLLCDAKGTAQLTARGTQSSMTGKHYDRVFTDDIVNLTDRISKAERERTKLVYMELQNVRNRGSRIYNTGTPWHKEDAISMMPNVRKYDCYTTGLMTEGDIRGKRESMTASMFAANYELRHIAEEDVIFCDASTGADPALCMDGVMHIDAAYDGADSTAVTICKRRDAYYLMGRLWRDHVDNRANEICDLYAQFRCSCVLCETNGDKGYLAKELRRRGLRVTAYHEDMNKFIKITSYLKAAWRDVRFCLGTDEAYLAQILDFNEHAEHDDAPDSAASVIRKFYFKKERTGYVSPFRG